LVVIAIIGILVALLLPAIQAAREAARRSQCLNNIRQMGISVMNYESAKKRLPEGATQRFGNDTTKNPPTPYTGDPTMFSWVSLLMPYLEEASLHDKVDWTIPLGVRNDQKDTGHHILFDTYLCPSDERVGLVNTWYGARGNYAGNVGVGVIWMNDTSPTQDCAWASLNPGYNCKNGPHWSPAQRNPKFPNSSLKRFGAWMVNKGRKMSEFTDGTSKTVSISEVRNIPGTDTRGVLHFGAGVLYMHDFPPNSTAIVERTRYCEPNKIAPCQDTVEEWRGDWRHFARSAHSGGVNSMMVDTSARFIADSISQETWIALGTPDWDEVISEDF
jgi:type II secretory pathway pseudopilin PulG